jgi:hypothetical protein
VALVVVSFLEFIVISWGLGAVVSLISIIEAMKDRQLTVSEIAAAFYYAFTAVFAFAILVMTMAPSSASILGKPFSQIDLLNLQFEIQPQVLAFSVIVVMLLLAVAMAVLVKMGRPITAAVMTLLFLATGFIGFLLLGFYPTLNIVVAALMVALISIPLAYVVYMLVQR